MLPPPGGRVRGQGFVRDADEPPRASAAQSRSSTARGRPPWDEHSSRTVVAGASSSMAGASCSSATARRLRASRTTAGGASWAASQETAVVKGVDGKSSQGESNGRLPSCSCGRKSNRGTNDGEDDLVAGVVEVEDVGRVGVGSVPHNVGEVEVAVAVARRRPGFHAHCRLFVRHGYIPVGHQNSGAPRLFNPHISLFLLVM